MVLLRDFGKNRAVILEPEGLGHWNFVGQTFFPCVNRSFRFRKGASFFVEPELSVYRKGSSKVFFHDRLRARALIPSVIEYSDGKDGEKVPLRIDLKEIVNNPKGKGEKYSMNPRLVGL
jgi:hypothetical protein